MKEWGEFLEEEGLIGVDYGISKTFFKERELSDKEVKEKAESYADKKEGFVRKINTKLQQLEKETEGFEEIKQRYYDLKDEMGGEMVDLEDELSQMRHFEELKKTIDHDIAKQKHEYKNLLDEVHKKIEKERRRYDNLVESIQSKEEEIKNEREEINELEEKEETVKERLDEIKDAVSEVEDRIQEKEEKVNTEEKHLLKLKELASDLEKDIKTKKKKEIEPLLEESESHKDKIIAVQNEILNKVKSAKEEMSSYRGEAEAIQKKFKDLFEKNSETSELIQNLEEEKLEMKKELEELKRKAQVFNIASKDTDIEEYLSELEDRFEHYKERKDSFLEQLQRLKNLIVGKEETVDEE